MDEASNCFKPNPLAANFDHNNHKPVTLGAVFQGAMNRVPRQTTTSKGALVWEAGIEKKVYVKLPSQCFQIASHYSLNCKTCVCVCVLNLAKSRYPNHYSLNCRKSALNRQFQGMQITCGVSAVLQVVIQAGGTTPKVMPAKPKFYLTCNISLSPSSWVKLT